MINVIFSLLTVIGIIYSLLVGRANNISNIILGSASKTFELAVNIFAFMALWLGIINIANKSGLLDKVTYLLKPLLKKIFPEIPENHESLNYISTNFVANMFGLGNAATPFAIKAMKSLKELNNRDVASNSMITFLILNTAGLTIIPTTIHLILFLIIFLISLTALLFPVLLYNHLKDAPCLYKKKNSSRPEAILTDFLESAVQGNIPSSSVSTASTESDIFSM